MAKLKRVLQWVAFCLLVPLLFAIASVLGIMQEYDDWKDRRHARKSKTT